MSKQNIHGIFFGLPLPLLLDLAGGGGDAASFLLIGGLPLPLLAGGGDGELKAGLPLPLFAGGDEVWGWCKDWVF